MNTILYLVDWEEDIRAQFQEKLNIKSQIEIEIPWDVFVKLGKPIKVEMTLNAK